MGGDESGAGRLLDAVADHLTARGLTECVDFYIPGRLPGTLPSSEHVGMWAKPDGGFEVWYRDMGSSRVLLESDDFATARRRFVDEAVELARGRGADIKDVADEAS